MLKYKYITIFIICVYLLERLRLLYFLTKKNVFNFQWSFSFGFRHEEPIEEVGAESDASKDPVDDVWPGHEEQGGEGLGDGECKETT